MQNKEIGTVCGKNYNAFFFLNVQMEIWGKSFNY